MKVENVIGTYVFTDTGERIHVNEICGVPKPGYELEIGVDGEYNILASTNDSDCVGGVCPIK